MPPPRLSSDSLTMTNSSPPTWATRSAAADSAAKSSRDGVQGVITNRVPEGVVEMLEVIEVEVERRDQRSARKLCAEDIEELGAIRETSQRVALGPRS